MTTNDEPKPLRKGVGYIRVSTTLQAEEGASLEIQTKAIKESAKSHKYKLTKIYADEGISGSTVKDRPGIQQCFEDAQNGKFDVLIVFSLTRFGRNARELLDNHNFLKELGIELLILQENIDSSTTSGKLMLGMFSVLAEWEKDMIAERMFGGKVYKASQGIPTSGSLPIGRKYNKKKMKWKLDKIIAKDLQWAAGEYLKPGGTLKEIVKGLSFPITVNNLRSALKDRCGDTWEENYKNGGTFTYKIPRILKDDIIKRIHERIDFNKKHNRTGIKNRYVLNGFIYCEKCNRGLTGQTQKRKHIYYRHPFNLGNDHICVPKPFTQINGLEIEEAVLHTIFELIADEPKFEAAIAERLPEKKTKAKLEAEIESDKKALNHVNKELEKLVTAYREGTLTKETIRKTEEGLIKQQERLTESLIKKERRFKNLPDVDSVKKIADQIRRNLLEKYSGSRRLDNMTYEDKRDLLHWLFEGKDSYGDRYGIYITKKGIGKDATVDFLLYGRMMLGGSSVEETDVESYIPSLQPEGTPKLKRTRWNLKSYKTYTVSSNRPDD